MDESHPWELLYLSEFCHVETTLEELSYARRSVLAGSWYLASQSSISLCGEGVDEQCAVRQWVEFYVTRIRKQSPWDSMSRDDLSTVLEVLNRHLSTRIFMVSSVLSLADLMLYYGLHRYMAEMIFSQKSKYVHLCRWFDHIQNFPSVRPFTFPLVVFHKTPSLLQ